MLSWLRRFNTHITSSNDELLREQQNTVRGLEANADLARQAIARSAWPDLVAINQFVAGQLALPRNQEPLRLLRHGYKVYSQNDEDGLIAEIFRRIGVENHSFVEFGVETGTECNTMWLLMQGWNGLWIEGSASQSRMIEASHAYWIEQGALVVRNALVTTANINELIGARYQGVIDLLSIDIDSNDYHVWEAIQVVAPRVVCIEYNANWRPPASITVPYDPNRAWDGSSHFGASLSALVKLGRAKGYRLVGCCMAGINAFFVREELCSGKFIESGDAAEHYEPLRFFLMRQEGHQPAIRPVQSV